LSLLKILLLVTFLFPDISHNNCTNFYLIRHAEKVRSDKTDSNPDLNEKGLLRAHNWKNYFSNKNISKIYSTNYKRTLNTIKPLALENGLEALIYSASDIEYNDFIKSNIGETILIVGHSNTIPGFVNKLINDNYYDQIEDTNNSNLYIVSICKSKITHRLIKVD
tara:strand:+ start:1281 stop:1775 length:495 start_codon:yes stop_codon:yes gene_type:complete